MSGAVIGYITNWVAIKMLFRPYDEKRVFGFKVPFTPGLIPKRRYILAEKTGRTISEYLLTDETLIERFCAESVKRGAEEMLDGILAGAYKSDMTLGAVFFGDRWEKSPKETIEDLRTKAPDFLSLFSGGDIKAFAEELENKLINSDKKISDLLGQSVSVNLKILLSESVPQISGRIIKIVRSPFFEETIKPIFVDIVNRSVKGFASLFIIPESAYDSFINSLVGYLENPGNHPVTEQRLLAICERLTDTDVSSSVRAVLGGDTRILSALFDTPESNSGAITELSEIIKDAGGQAADKLCASFFSMETGHLLSKAGPKFHTSVKSAVMSRYEAAIRKGLPHVLGAVELPGVIETKINDFEMKEAEDIIVSVVDRELKAITYFGGILGFIIGLIPPVLQSLGI